VENRGRQDGIDATLDDTVDEVLEHTNAVVKEAGSTDRLPYLPVISDDVPTDRFRGQLPGDPDSAAYFGGAQSKV
jgi:hypothetical protein